jgi:hypothetical protein
MASASSSAAIGRARCRSRRRPGGVGNSKDRVHRTSRRFAAAERAACPSRGREGRARGGGGLHSSGMIASPSRYGRAAGWLDAPGGGLAGAKGEYPHCPSIGSASRKRRTLFGFETIHTLRALCFQRAGVLVQPHGRTRSASQRNRCAISSRRMPPTSRGSAPALGADRRSHRSRVALRAALTRWGHPGGRTRDGATEGSTPALGAAASRCLVVAALPRRRPPWLA